MSRPLLSVVGADVDVPLLDGRRVRHVNLDHAASAPALESVAERVAAALPYYASVHRGAGYASQVSTSLYEDARATVGAFVGARPDDVTVLVRHTTDALNLLASAVPGRVLVLDLEHHANLLPWREASGGVETLATAPTVAETLARLESALASGGHALVAVTGASNVTGEALPLDAVVASAHAHGARVVVDGAQLLAHRRFSLTETGADYVAFSGHKLYAPFGSGALVGRRDWLDAAPPYLAGGGAVRQVSATDVTWADAPARHEAGTPNLLGAVALAAAADALSALDGAAAQQHEQALVEDLVGGLSAVPGVRVARLWPDSAARVGVVTFALEGTDPGLLAAYLAAEHGVSVRDGRFCAHPLLDSLGWGAGAVRAGVGLASSAEDVQRLLHGVRSWVAGDVHGDYVQEGGTWAVRDDRRPAPFGLTLAPTAAAPCAVV
ncbi:aminotransferase class V-fold PLP-dependent enzyme [Aeromicrobium massiliense]|uniref:aminotransferase class V-fold PLP-dependent enzyme n=1 Tax=Aeromicrobium massiliense TaxID=1464554 RepID=UPI000577053F|nr:aminotransferase class V-fold PLP-dependent enzyme [Aeromicrobium massiliense]